MSAVSIGTRGRVCRSNKAAALGTAGRICRVGETTLSLEIAAAVFPNLVPVVLVSPMLMRAQAQDPGLQVSALVDVALIPSVGPALITAAQMERDLVSSAALDVDLQVSAAPGPGLEITADQQAGVSMGAVEQQAVSVSAIVDPGLEVDMTDEDELVITSERC